jgi:hypothetical protein
LGCCRKNNIHTDTLICNNPSLRYWNYQKDLFSPYLIFPLLFFRNKKDIICCFLLPIVVQKRFVHVIFIISMNFELIFLLNHTLAFNFSWFSNMYSK